jgi:hypothetical protein
MLPLRTALAAVVAAVAAAQQPLPSPPPLQPWSLEGAVTAARGFAANASLAAPTGLTRLDYLHTAATVVDYWTAQQAPNGSIIDPVTHIEEQYSTPHFAWAAAAVATVLNRTDLVEPAARALDFAVASMVNGSASCAQATCDFYAVPVMRAYMALSPVVTPARAAGWKAALQGLDPAKT